MVFKEMLPDCSIITFLMYTKDCCCIGSHWTVKININMRNFFFYYQTMQIVNYLLSTFNSKGRNNYLTAAIISSINRFCKFFFSKLDRIVQSITIRTFTNQIVNVRNLLRISNNRQTGTPQISGKSYSFTIRQIKHNDS